MPQLSRHPKPQLYDGLTMGWRAMSTNKMLPKAKRQHGAKQVTVARRKHVPRSGSDSCPESSATEPGGVKNSLLPPPSKKKQLSLLQATRMGVDKVLVALALLMLPQNTIGRTGFDIARKKYKTLQDRSGQDVEMT